MNEHNIVQNTTLNVSLPEPLKDYVQERVSDGIYSNPSDYVRSLIRDDMRLSAQRRLETLLLEGINSGDPKPIDWEAIREEAYRRSGNAAPGLWITSRPSADEDLASQMRWYIQHATPELAERFMKAVQGT